MVIFLVCLLESILSNLIRSCSFFSWLDVEVVADHEHVGTRVDRSPFRVELLWLEFKGFLENLDELTDDFLLHDFPLSVSCSRHPYCS